MKKSLKNTINDFAKNAKVLTKKESKKVKGGITNTDVMGD